MIHKHILYGNFAGHRFEISKITGELIYDTHGKEYIDFTSGWNVANLGWNNPEIKAAISNQLEKESGVPFWHSVDIQNLYAQELVASLPGELDTCIRATSGTEAVEVAIKIARSYTGHKTILGFRETYHGQLFASMALGTPILGLESISPMVPNIEQLTYPTSQEDLDTFLQCLEKRLVKGDVAALISEPGIITGWGNVLITAENYLKRTHDILKKYNALLIVDEVGTGFSRTGSLFAIEHEAVTPDILVLGKAIANGSGTIAATVIQSKLSEPAATTANLTSTFSWNPLATAAALATLRIHKREKTWEEATRKASVINLKLQELQQKGAIVTTRGRGLEIMVQFKNSETCSRITKEARERGLLLIGDGESIIQLMPPLTISDPSLVKGLDILESVILNDFGDR